MNLAGHQRIALLSDIHANAHAFSAALERVRALDIDALVIMGDLLTYGCEPKRTLELLNGALAQWEAILIAGNHDQIYFNLPKRDLAYINRLPEWIRESALWTKVQMAGENILALELPWREEVQLGDCYVAHANPHGFGNWGYLNSEADLRNAADVLAHKGVKMGIFGHSHRPGIYTLDRHDQLQREGSRRVYTPQECASIRMIVANPGSIGQPRGRTPHSTFLTVTREGDRNIGMELHKVAYDIGRHIESIEKSGLSADTKEVLKKFHRGT